MNLNQLLCYQFDIDVFPPQTALAFDDSAKGGLTIFWELFCCDSLRAQTFQTLTIYLRTFGSKIETECSLKIEEISYSFWLKTSGDSQVRAVKDHGKRFRSRPAASFSVHSELLGGILLSVLSVLTFHFISWVLLIVVFSCFILSLISILFCTNYVNDHLGRSKSFLETFFVFISFLSCFSFDERGGSFLPCSANVGFFECCIMPEG